MNEERKLKAYERLKERLEELWRHGGEEDYTTAAIVAMLEEAQRIEEGEE